MSADTQDYGVHNFIVPLRDGSHKPLPGIELGDIGPKGAREALLCTLDDKATRFRPRNAHTHTLTHTFAVFSRSPAQSGSTRLTTALLCLRACVFRVTTC